MANCRGISKRQVALVSFMRNVVITGVPSPAQSDHSLLLRFGRPLHTSTFRVADKPAAGNTAKTEEGGKNLALRDRLKSVVAEYGSTAIVFHVTISLTSLGLCYTAVKRSVITKEKKRNVNFLLTERKGRGGKFWPEVVAVRTERSVISIWPLDVCFNLFSMR